MPFFRDQVASGVIFSLNNNTCLVKSPSSVTRWPPALFYPQTNSFSLKIEGESAQNYMFLRCPSA